MNAPLALDEQGRQVALALLLATRARGRVPLRFASFIQACLRRGVEGSAAAVWLEGLLAAGHATLRERRKGSSFQPVGLVAGARDRLEDLVWPGRRGQRLQALEESRARVKGLGHPLAGEVSALLNAPEAEMMDSGLLRALVAIAAHADTGESLSANVFSARHLGSAKALRQVRGRLERLVGPLEAFGVRDGASLLLVGGEGALGSASGELQLTDWKPFFAIPRELATAVRPHFPPPGVLVVENFAVFEACCRGEVPAARGTFLVWSAGYPGRAVRAIVEAAEAAGGPVRAWMDLDLDGVRIARLIHSWAPRSFEAFRMNPDEVRNARVSQALTGRATARIRADLEANPAAPLAQTLRALTETGRWVEQETQLF